LHPVQVKSGAMDSIILALIHQKYLGADHVNA
jgi:hypothetical protein